MTRFGTISALYELENFFSSKQLKKLSISRAGNPLDIKILLSFVQNKVYVEQMLKYRVIYEKIVLFMIF